MATPASDLNIDLLIKMLGMSQSDNDNQALVALRKANSLVAKVDGGWDALLRGKVTVIADPFASAVAPPKPDTGPSTWTPSTTRPAPPHTTYHTQPPRVPDFDYTYAKWNSTTGTWDTPPTRRPPPPPPPQQTLNTVARFAKRQGQWILKSDKPLVVGLYVSTLRADGNRGSERVGSLIHSDSTGHYYNIEGKTNFQPISALSI